jgi:hypothetical protein
MGLTQDQKVRLIEMCNALFPEHREITLTKMNTLNFGYTDHGSHTSRDMVSVHWFEFCMLKLARKLRGRFETGLAPFDLSTFYIHTVNGLNHPVDFLYPEFKKLRG